MFVHIYVCVKLIVLYKKNDKKYNKTHVINKKWNEAKWMYKEEHKKNCIRFILWGAIIKLLCRFKWWEATEMNTRLLKKNLSRWWKSYKDQKLEPFLHRKVLFYSFSKQSKEIESPSSMNDSSKVCKFRDNRIIILYLTYILCQLCTKIHKTVQTVHYTLQLTWLSYIHFK